jgi:plastocyanin
VRHLRLAIALVSIVAVAACTSGAPPGWTYAPAPPATPRPSASGSAAPSGSVAPSGLPSASGSPAASGSGGPAASGATVTVVATTSTKFDTPKLTTAADKPFTLVFDNQDTTAPHNVILTNPDGSNVQMGGDTNFFVGPGKREYQIGPLKAGSYPFHCQVHPQAMTGTLTAQ